MATIMRSSKYIRGLNGYARRIVLSRDNRYFTSESLEFQRKSIDSYFTKSYATAPAIQRNERITNFDNYLVKLDRNIRQFGRLFKVEVDHVLSRIRKAGYVSSFDGLLLLRCCGELLIDTSPASRNDLVHEIWNTLETLKIPMDVSHFNALLRVYLENNYDLSPIEILTKMKEKDIEPNRLTYQRLILYTCKKGDIIGATKILEFMSEKGLPLNEAIFNALITGHSEANDMGSANNVLNVMKDAGVVPGSATYTALMCAYAKRGDMECIKKIIADCGTKNLYLHDKELFKVIQVLVANSHNNEINDLLSIMPNGPNYNFDAMHAILKIIETGNVDVALKILATMRRRKNTNEQTEDPANGVFLIRKMVNSKMVIDKIIEACNKLEQQGHHARAYFIALERSLLNGDTELSMPLLMAYKDSGATIREHFLWPILAANGKASNYQAIQDVVKFMTTELNIIPGIKTVTDYILPYAVGKWDDIANTLEGYGIPRKTILNAIPVRMILDKKIRRACYFMTRYPSEYEPRYFYRALADALRDTDDTQSFAIILRTLHESRTDRSEDVIDTGFRQALTVLPIRKDALINELMNRMIDMGLGLSPDMARQLNNFFHDNITAGTTEKIKKLTSGTLLPVPISEIQSSITIDDSKKQHLMSCILSRDGPGIVAITKSLNVKFTPAVYAQIIDVFCATSDLERAESWVNKFQSEYPEISLDVQKTTNYAALLIKNGRFDDALGLITNWRRKFKPIAQRIGIKKVVKKLLDTAAGTGNVENTQKLFDALVSSNYSEIENYMLRPLVKVHIVKNDLEGALDAIAKISETHRCTPSKMELSKKFIDAEDAHSLQRLTDLSTRIHGESNTLIDLVFAFIECGRLRQARKILETPGLRLRAGKLNTTAHRYLEEQKHEYLDQLFEVTKGLPVYDRQQLYDVLVKAYSNKNDWKRGLNLWTRMQDEDIHPSQSFLNTLAALLKNNNVTIPFSYVEPTPSLGSVLSNPTEYYVTEFNAAVQAGNIDGAENIWRNVSTNHKEYIKVTSALIEEILKQQNDVDKASEIAKVLIPNLTERDTIVKALSLVWNGLIDAKKYETFKDFDKLLSDRMKRKYQFVKYRTHAGIREVGLARFLADFGARLSESAEENLKIVQNELHFRTLIEELEKDPSALNNFRPIAEKLSRQGIQQPISTIWSIYFQQQKPEADEIWSKFLSNAKHIVFHYVVEKSIENNDVETLERVRHKLGSNPVLSVEARFRVLHSLLRAYENNGRYDDVIKVLENESTDVINHMKTVKRTIIRRLKSNVVANGKSLPSSFDDIES